MSTVRLRADGFLSRHFSRPSITYKDSAHILLPIIAENAFLTVFGLINTAMISSAGMASLTSVSLVDSLNIFLQTFYMGISTGASVIVANYRGRGEKKLLHDASVQSVVIVTLTAIVTTLLIFLMNRPLLTLLFGGAEKDVMSKALLYLLGSTVTLPLMAMVGAVGGVLRGIGEGRTQVYITVVNSVLYLLSNILFLLVLEMGILGLVISISVNRIAGVCVCLFFLKITKSNFSFQCKELLRVDFRMLKKILFIGLPASAESLFFNGGKLVAQSIVVPLGTNPTAAYNVSIHNMGLSQIFSMSISRTIYTIVGICIGANRKQDIKGLVKSYVLLNSAILACFTALFFPCFSLLMKLYHVPSELHKTIYICVAAGIIVQPVINSLGFLLSDVIRAAGDGIFCTLVSLASMWLCRVAFAWLLGTVLDYGVIGVWMGMVLDWLVRSLIFSLRYKGTRWFARSDYLSSG